jgi:NTP pyrophosphatase (non-canonical NTP hydrolase)
MRDEEYILKSAVNRWGINMQKIICMEECGELIQALAKSMRPSREDNFQTRAFDLGNIAEEIADVELCLAQMKIAMPDIVADIEQIKTEKLDRLKSRILKSVGGNESDER